VYLTTVYNNVNSRCSCVIAGHFRDSYHVLLNVWPLKYQPCPAS
jgi:hypothetical protein